MKACTQCGRCCTNDSFMGSMQFSGADFVRWKREGRADILDWGVVLGSDKDGPRGDLWISPVTGREAERCPFVRKMPGRDKYTCRIYDTRPEVCRSYPEAVDHMEFVSCEMLEPGDTDATVKKFMKAR
jgi:Fe-S-cluster containining protein